VERPSLNSVDSALLDLEAWPTVDEHVFDDPVQRGTFERRRRAVQLFVAGVQGDRIVSETGISSRMALYWFQRALKIHPDGRIGVCGASFAPSVEMTGNCHLDI
jgi:hypothetical protein